MAEANNIQQARFIPSNYGMPGQEKVEIFLPAEAGVGSKYIQIYNNKILSHFHTWLENVLVYFFVCALSTVTYIICTGMKYCHGDSCSDSVYFLYPGPSLMWWIIITRRQNIILMDSGKKTPHKYFNEIYIEK